MSYFEYNKQLNQLARINKRSMNKAEACMWKYVLGRRQLEGYRFRRQRPIRNYIVDFVCFELMLVIEIDGFTHEDCKVIENDRGRDEYLRAQGFTVLRFSNQEVLNRLDDVKEKLLAWIIQSRSNA